VKLQYATAIHFAFILLPTGLFRVQGTSSYAVLEKIYVALLRIAVSAFNIFIQ